MTPPASLIRRMPSAERRLFAIDIAGRRLVQISTESLGAVGHVALLDHQPRKMRPTRQAAAKSFDFFDLYIDAHRLQLRREPDDYDPVAQPALRRSQSTNSGSRLARSRNIRADARSCDWVRRSSCSVRFRRSVAVRLLLPEAGDAITRQRVVIGDGERVQSNLDRRCRSIRQGVCVPSDSVVCECRSIMRSAPIPGASSILSRRYPRPLPWKNRR